MTGALSEEPTVRRPLPTTALVAVGLGCCWVAFALAETVLGDLDSMASAAALASDRGRVVAAGLLHLLAGFLLALGLVGVAGRAWVTVPGRLGLVGCALLAVAVGSFGMLHLLAVELSDDSLDSLEGFGAWGIPVLVVALVGMFALTLLLAGLARSGDVPWWAVALAGAGAVLHFLRGEGVAEIASHWLLAAGLLAGAASVVKARGAEPQAATGAGAG